jgi:YbbR domain-containing protein
MIPFLQNLILHDFWLKLFSFALACLIWFTVNIAIKNDISPVASLSLAPTEEVVLRDLPIAVLSSAQEMNAFTVNPKTADVTLQGDLTTLRNLRKQDVRVLVDLSDRGVLRDSRRRIDVSTPAGVTHIKVEPEEVQVVTAPKN